MSKAERNARPVNSARRQFLRRTSTLAAIYFAGAFTLTQSKPAHAVIPIPTEFVRKFIDKARKWWDQNGKDLKSLVEDYLDKFKVSNYFSALATSTDAANVIKKTVHDRHMKRITQPNPSEGCAAEAATTAASATEDTLKESLKNEAFDNARKFIDGLPSNDPRMTREYERALTNDVEKYESLEELLASLDARDFAGPAGYIDGESGDMDLYRRISTARARRAILNLGGSLNDRTVATSVTAYSRITVIENALDFLYSRRIRSSEAFTQAHSNADEYERDILQDLATPVGGGVPAVSAVDLEAFEVRRTHLSDTWQEAVSENTSFDSLTKELALMATHTNMLDSRIYEVRQRLNALASVRALSVFDSGSLPSRNGESELSIEEEEVLLRR